MSKSATPPTDVVRELRDDELETVSGGYVFTDVMVELFLWWLRKRYPRRRSGSS